MASNVAHGHQVIGHGEEEHTSAQEYVRVAIILAIITAIEVFIYYLPTARGWLVPALIILSLAKFAAVVGYFMHLKFDNRLFQFMFISGLVVSLSVFLAFLAMFWYSTSYRPLP